MRKLKKYKPTRFMAKTSHYDKDAADYAVMFIESLCHTKGTWAGKPFELIDWQEQIIRDLFGVLKPNGYRQFNTAYIEIPKKQGKSELAAAVALLLLCGDGEERAEVYGCAADRNQAKIVFDVAVDMVRFCPALSKRVKILESQKKITYLPTNSSYQVLSADVANKHGFNTHGVIFDELHTQPNRKLFDVMLQGSGDARMQPLYFLITTAGNDTNSICYEVHQKAIDIAEGRKVDPTFYSVIYGAAEDEDWTDPKVWKKANPSLGITVGTVTAAPVSASDETSLDLALGQKPDTVKENGKDVNVLTVNVAKSFKIDTLPEVPTEYTSSDAVKVTIDRVVFDLNGNTLTIDASNWKKTENGKEVRYGWSIKSNVTFSDGAISVTNSDSNVGAFSVADKATFTLDNVALSTTGSAVVLQPQGGDNVGGTFNLIDSTVYAGSKDVCVIAVSTNASASSTSSGLTDDNKVTINIENSNIYTYAPTAVNASDYAKDSTALLINVPADVTIEGSALVGTRQALIVRGGNAEISDSTLTVVRVADPADTDDPGDVNQKWDQGNQMPAGALVIGNDDLDTTKAESTAEAYQYKTTVILDSDVVLSVTDTSNSTAKVVIGSDFANETLKEQKDTKWPAGTADKDKTYANISTMPIMVYLNGGGVLSGSDISYVRTWDKGTTQLVNCGDMSGVR